MIQSKIMNSNKFNLEAALERCRLLRLHLIIANYEVLKGANEAAGMINQYGQVPYSFGKLVIGLPGAFRFMLEEDVSMVAPSLIEFCDVSHTELRRSGGFREIEMLLKDVLLRLDSEVETGGEIVVGAMSLFQYFSDLTSTAHFSAIGFTYLKCLEQREDVEHVLALLESLQNHFNDTVFLHETHKNYVETVRKITEAKASVS